MQNENNKKRNGKGYYIALIACLAAVGISGYVFVQTAQESAVGDSLESAPSVTEYHSQTEKEEPSSPAEKDKEAMAVEDPMEDAYEETVNEILWPIQGNVTATFSRDTLTYSETMADWRTHEGLDIAANMGDLVAATEAGTVTAVYEDDFLGTVVVVSHSGDLATLYGNLMESTAVAVGDTVAAGQTLGQVGTTALLEAAEPAHLHFEVFSQGEPVDPMNYLP